MEELIKLENGDYSLTVDTVNTIVEIENQMKQLKKIQDSYKEKLLKNMEEKDILKIDMPDLAITRKAATTRESLDSKTLREELPEVYDSYVKISDVKGSLLIKIK